MSQTEQKNSIEAILAKAKSRGIVPNERYKTLDKTHDDIEEVARENLVKQSTIEENKEEVLEDAISASADIAKAELTIDTPAIAKLDRVETATPEPTNPILTIPTFTTTQEIQKLFYYLCDEMSSYTTDEMKTAKYLLKRTEFGKINDVLIKREEFGIDGGVNLRKLSDSLKALEERGLFSWVTRQEKNLKYKLYTIENRFFKRYEKMLK
jgi:hypothetical protein